jgi:CRP/FNR family transcriptional regulator
MITVFENYLRSQNHLSDSDIARVSAMATARKLKRNEPLLTSGEICRHKTFISKGMLRTYNISADGNETILQFSPELTWSIDAESYDKVIPSSYNITAVEPSEILMWRKNDFNTLLKELPGLKLYSEQLISHNIYIARQRLLSALSASPEEKYKDFALNHPELLARLPLRMIAAYLGISLKTLTRLRHAQWAG